MDQRLQDEVRVVYNIPRKFGAISYLSFILVIYVVSVASQITLLFYVAICVYIHVLFYKFDNTVICIIGILIQTQVFSF